MTILIAGNDIHFLAFVRNPLLTLLHLQEFDTFDMKFANSYFPEGTDSANSSVASDRISRYHFSGAGGFLNGNSSCCFKIRLRKIAK